MKADDTGRPRSIDDLSRRNDLINFLEQTDEDGFIERVLLPLFRELGFEKVRSAGHDDKMLEYGKDIWMRFRLPTHHTLYFGIQAKKGKIDARGSPTATNVNIAEIHHQTLMMLGHQVFDPETSRRALVDHAIIAAGGTITKQARNWLAEKLDASKRSQILFMDRLDIVDLFMSRGLPIPEPVCEFEEEGVPDLLGPFRDLLEGRRSDHEEDS